VGLLQEFISKETHEFVKKVFEKSGIDCNGSYLPKNLHPQHTLDPHGGQDEGFAEARLVMGGAVDEVLRKSGELLHNMMMGPARGKQHASLGWMCTE
jgi:hypothetical protein